MEIFLSPYLLHMREKAFMAYDYYFNNLVRPIGFFVIFLCILLLYGKKNGLHLKFYKQILWGGLIILLVYFLLVVLYWTTNINLKILALVAQLSMNYSLLLGIPSAMIAVGVASYILRNDTCRR